MNETNIFSKEMQRLCTDLENSGFELSDSTFINEEDFAYKVFSHERIHITVEPKRWYVEIDQIKCEGIKLLKEVKELKRLMYGC